jgi:hypothetical protein
VSETEPMDSDQGLAELLGVREGDEAFAELRRELKQIAAAERAAWCSARDIWIR